MRPFAVTIVLIALAPFALAAPPPSEHVAGTNLSAPDYWSRAIVFTNVARMAGEWISQTSDEWDTGRDIPLTPDGYPARLEPGQWAGAPILVGQDGNYPAGEYLVTWKGRGIVAFRSDVTDVAASVTAESVGGSKTTREYLNVRPANSGILLQIRETDPKDPIRDIRVIPPDCADMPNEQVFHPEFLRWVDDYPVLRFMDWQRTNNAAKPDWSTRVKPGYRHQNGPKGVALEYMIDLCNEVDASPWFCMPDLADAAYIRKFASLVHERLDPDLHVYVEFSNEVWNNGFQQAHRVEAEGRKRWPDVTPFEARLRQYGERSVEVFTIWEDVFGGADRLVRVIGSQFVGPWASKTILEWNDVAEHADALAVAPYFGYELGDPRAIKKTGVDARTASPEQLLDAAERDIAAGRKHTREQSAIAKRFDLALIAYEGGQHMTPLNAGEAGDWTSHEDVIRNLKDANGHPRMREIYRSYLETWTADGGGLMVHYMSPGHYYGRWGSYSIRENLLDPPSAKERGLWDFVNGAGE